MNDKIYKQMMNLHPLAPMRQMAPYRDQDKPKHVQIAEEKGEYDIQPQKSQKKKVHKIKKVIQGFDYKKDDSKLIMETLKKISSTKMIHKNDELPQIFNRDTSVISMSRNHGTIDSRNTSIMSIHDKLIKVPAGHGTFVTEEDVQDLTQNLSKKSLHILNKKYPQLTGRARSQLNSYTIDELTKPKPPQLSSRFRVNLENTMITTTAHNFGFMDDREDTLQTQEDYQPLMLPPLKKKKSRFVLSKETIKEFKLKLKDIPEAMREDGPSNYRDHINQNISLTQNYNDINRIIFLSKIKFNIENQILSSERAKNRTMKLRSHHQQHMKKWDDFRIRKQIAVDKYIIAKRKQKTAQQLLRQIFSQKFTNICARLVPDFKDYRRWLHAQSFLRLKFYLAFRRSLRKNRGFVNKMTNQLRSATTYLIQFKKDSIEQKAKQLVFGYLTGYYRKKSLSYNFQRTWNQIYFIQKQLASRFIYKDCKFVLLNNYWDKILTNLKKKAKKLKNDTMISICKLIEDIKVDVREYVLRQFLIRNQLLSSVSFYKSRLKVPHANHDEINVQIFKLLKFTTDQYSDATNLMSKETLKAASIPDNVLKDFNLLNEGKKAHQINSFKDIAWIDPFPDESATSAPSSSKPKKKKKEKEKKAKKEKQQAKLEKEIQEIMKGVDTKSTMTSLYLPSRQLMIKLMRGCINVETPEQLWIYELTKRQYNQIDDDEVEELAKQYNQFK